MPDPALAEAAFTVACDMPFLHPDAVRLVVERAGEADVVIPRIGDQLETMHAAYAKACLPHIEERLLTGQLKIVGFFDRVRVREVPEAAIAGIRAPELLFMNVNTPEELQRAREIAHRLETTPEQVLEAMEAGTAYAPVSLSAGAGDEGELDPMETIGTEDAEYERSEQRASLQPALEALPAREREILRMRFEEGMTQTQIAERVGVSQMHVSRLIRKSLARMRQELS